MDAFETKGLFYNNPSHGAAMGDSQYANILGLEAIFGNKEQRAAYKLKKQEKKAAKQAKKNSQTGSSDTSSDSTDESLGNGTTFHGLGLTFDNVFGQNAHGDNSSLNPDSPSVKAVSPVPKINFKMPDFVTFPTRTPITTSDLSKRETSTGSKTPAAAPGGGTDGTNQPANDGAPVANNMQPPSKKDMTPYFIIGGGLLLVLVVVLVVSSNKNTPQYVPVTR